jgi:hypothetical protein
MPEDLTPEDFYNFEEMREPGVWYTHDGFETDIQGAINDYALGQFLGEDD